MAFAGNVDWANAFCFPIRDGRRRWRSPRGRNREEALLLNPCEDRPEEHLQFIAGGLVRPVEIDEVAKRGRWSIEIYGLLRQDLVDARKETETFIRTALEHARAAVQDAVLATTAEARANGDPKAAQTWRSGPFLALARQVLQRSA